MAADVVVVGAGIVGLTSALRLRQAGADVVVWTAQPPEQTTSAVAAAVWYPTRVEGQPRVLEWGERTFAEFVRQAADGVPGVVMRVTRMLHRAAVQHEPWWAPAVGDLRWLAPAEVHPPFVGGWRFTAPTVEMPRYLPWLVARFTAAGGEVRLRRVESLREAAGAAPIVVNATGLAARDLCGDGAVEPARGQIVLTTNPGLTESVRDQDNPEGYTYIHPRRDDVVLGGTFESGVWDATPDPVACEAIRRRCLALVPELAAARTLGYRAGLRPTRQGGVRLETGSAGLIHNYGHGGAGVTLAWGCADRVVELAVNPPASRATTAP
jgi:D-amino-acid oxidase